MALATTTLSAAVAVTDNTIVVASAASIATGRLLLCDQEIMRVSNAWVSGTTIPVLRGTSGTKTSAHVLTAAVTHGTAADFANPAAQAVVTYPVAGRPVVVTSITAATSTLTLPTAGTDMRVVINLASAIALTVPVPTKDMDGTTLWIVSSTVAAHAIIFTTGLGGVSTGYTTLTAASGAQICLCAIACNGTWNIPSAPAWTNTVTKVTAAIT